MFEGLPCNRDVCRLIEIKATKTMVAFTPVYNRKGYQVNLDPNTKTIEYDCQTCGERFTKESCLGVTKWTKNL